MRDAVGGTFMIRVFLIFLATYIVFIGIALNYAKGFRVKNKILDIIEQNEGIENMDYTDTDSNGVIGKINSYLNVVKYNLKDRVELKDCSKAFKNSAENDESIHLYEHGYCIRKIEGPTIDENIRTEYYQVSTFVDIYIPLVELHYLIPIKGETRKIERINR